MPSASPENRTHKRRRSRSRSSEIPAEPSARKSSNDARNHIKDRDRKDPSRHVRRGEHDRHRMTSPEHSRSSGGRNKEASKSGNHHEERSRPPDTGREDKHRDRDTRGKGERQRDQSSLAPTNVRIKEEPTSEDEEARRRRRRSRFSAANAEDHRFPRRSRPELAVAGSGSLKQEPKDEDAANKPKAKVNFGLSGKLAEDTNVFNGVVIKYNEPTEARKPGKRWRLYPFKGDEALPMLAVHRQSAYLLGRERKIADIPIDHPSCSKQHAVLQFRAVQYEREDGRIGRRIRPYIIDLDSANGTYVNNARIESRRYVELIERDVVKFGFSSREYVLLHEGSATADDEEEEAADADSPTQPPDDDDAPPPTDEPAA